MREHVFGPLGMRHTVADHVDSIIPWRSGFYERRDDGAVLNAPYVDNSYKWAGGGFLSTPEDLIRFAQAHLDATILGTETIEVWWTSQQTSDGEATNYGMGWQTAELDGVRLVLHGGGSIGGTSLLAIAPDERVILMITCNLSGARLLDAPQRILRAFLDVGR
jgi:CubicO group peptidase (beta-lactamase class C family)